MTRMRTTHLAATAALCLPLGCDSIGTETDNPMGPQGVELRRSSQPYETEATVPAADARALADAQRAFAAALLGDVATRAAADENIFLGAHSITRVLTMTLAGARGITETEMTTALQTTLPVESVHPAMNTLSQTLAAGMANNDVVYRTLDSVWLARDHAIQDPFLDVLSQHYDAGVFLVDFEDNAEAARGSINSWVADATDGFISELFGPGQFDATTELALTNAAYLSAPWQDRFDPTETTTQEFALPDGNVVEVPMMDRLWEYPYAFTVEWRALELPFRESSASMVLVLPNPGKMEEFLTTFDGDRIQEIVDGLEPARNNPKTVWAGVPRFEFSSSVDLQPSLEALGMVTAFDPLEANLTGIDPEGELYVGSFVHNTTVGVDEYGTTAAAATGEVMVPSPITPKLFFDRPFVFFIYDHETSAVLFVGRFARPAGEARPPTTPPVELTDAERICEALDASLCDARTMTVTECLAALEPDDAVVLEECADCVQAAHDSMWGGELGLGPPCDVATCADYCPDHPF